MFKLKDKVIAEYDKRELTKSEIGKNGSLQVDMVIIQLDEKDETNSNQQKKLAMKTYKQNKKLSNEYTLREGHEREWIERVKILMRRLTQKSFYEQLTELIPLARNHSDIRNAIKAKRMAIRYETDNETVEEFLARLGLIYGNIQSKKHKNKTIKCHHCKRRGHIRKTCPIRMVMSK